MPRIQTVALVNIDHSSMCLLSAAALVIPLEIAVTIASKHGTWHSTIISQAAPLNLSTIASEASRF